MRMHLFYIDEVGTSGGAGMILALCMLTAGIIGIAT